MKGRTVEAYERVFSAIAQEFPQLQPKIVMSDFEQGLIRGLKHAWPEAIHKGCRFHFNQALFRKTQGK